MRDYEGRDNYGAIVAKGSRAMKRRHRMWPPQIEATRPSNPSRCLVYLWEMNNCNNNERRPSDMPLAIHEMAMMASFLVLLLMASTNGSTEGLGCIRWERQRRSPTTMCWCVIVG